MTTVFDPRSQQSGGNIATLASDPSRWNQPLACGGWNDVFEIGTARREVAATVSAIVGGSHRIEMRHNNEGKWAVLIADDVLSTTIVMYWSRYTTDADGTRREITRGEAMSYIVHECMHVLETTEVNVPSWILDQAHVVPFHNIVNFAEDVRIEDLGEDRVPAFANLRQRENDRLVRPNVVLWAHHDLVRKVCLPLFCERSCETGARGFSRVLASDPDIARLVDECRPHFMNATYASSTDEVVERLRPMYEILAPYLPVSDGGTGGEPDTDGDETVTGGEPVETQGGTSSEGDGDEQAEPHDAGDDGDTDEKDTDEDGDGSDAGDDGDTDDDGEANGGEDDSDDEDGGGEQSKTITHPTWGGETFVPNSPRGDWDNVTPLEESDSDDPWGDRLDDVIEGRPIDTMGGDGSDSTLTQYESDTALTKVRVTKALRRVLQDNANGGWSTRKKAGTFDPRQSTRLALGDMRTFRKKRGARGSLDYSLVLCLDASGSVTGEVGTAIAQSGLSVYEAASKISGLDVAMCAYGSGVHVAIPFDSTIRDVHRDGSRNRGRLSSLMDACAWGVGGSTAEDHAITWAIATSRRRNAESQMIVVMTDGVPNSQHAMPTMIEGARNLGIRTGGIGVMHDAPEYHEYSTTIETIDELPIVLGSLITTMMKGRK